MIPDFWVMACKHFSVGLTCRWCREKSIYIYTQIRCYISPISPEASIEPIFTKYDVGAYLPHIIIHSWFRINQLRGFDSVRWRIFPFPMGKHVRHYYGAELRCCTAVQLVIMLRCVDIAARQRHKLYLADLHCGRHHISTNAGLIVFTSLLCLTLLVIINIF